MPVGSQVYLLEVRLYLQLMFEIIFLNVEVIQQLKHVSVVYLGWEVLQRVEGRKDWVDPSVLLKERLVQFQIKLDKADVLGLFFWRCTFYVVKDKVFNSHNRDLVWVKPWGIFLGAKSLCFELSLPVFTFYDFSLNLQVHRVIVLLSVGFNIW